MLKDKLARLSAFTFILAVSVFMGPAGARNTQVEISTQETQEVKLVDHKQIQCMADNIYYEAGSEPIEGKAAVARVVLNRIDHGGFGSTPCKVVYQSNHVQQTNNGDETFWVKICQFSWVCEGKGNPNRNSTRYQNSLQIAKEVLLYDKYKDVIPATVLFFHNRTIVNQWPHEVVKIIGNHVFYAKKTKRNVKQKNQFNKKSSEAFIQPSTISREAQIES